VVLRSDLVVREREGDEVEETALGGSRGQHRDTVVREREGAQVGDRGEREEGGLVAEQVVVAVDPLQGREAAHVYRQGVQLVAREVELA